MGWRGAIGWCEEDYFVFERYRDIVIPGRREATSPESITTIVSMDSGLAPRGAPRNDEEGRAGALRPQRVLLHLAAADVEERHRGLVAQWTGGQGCHLFETL